MPITSSLTKQRDAPEAGRVRVLDAPHVPTDDNPRPPSEVGLLLGFAAVMVLGLWLTAADAPVTSTSEDTQQLAEAARQQPEVAPDLVGATIDEATPRVRKTMAVSGVLPDGTQYRVWGLPVMSYPAPAPGGSFVFESERGVRALGSTTYTLTGDDAAPAVTFDDGLLRFSAGPWRGDVLVHAGILGELGHDVTSLVDAVQPSLVDGALVVSLDDPLRWPEPGELVDGVQSHHGRFVVVLGCPPHRDDVVCDPTGAIGVIGLTHPVGTSELAIRLGAEDAGRLMVDPVTGMEWRVPAGWQAAPDRLTSITVPEEVFTVSTQPLEPGGVACPQMLTELGPHDALVTVLIGGTDTLQPWPRPIAASDLGPSAAVWGEPCAARPELDVLAGAFTLDAIPLRVLVAFGEAASSQTRAEAWRLLDSISVNPEM